MVDKKAGAGVVFLLQVMNRRGMHRSRLLLDRSTLMLPTLLEDNRRLSPSIVHETATAQSCSVMP
jgi:hypothetical protein